MCSDASDHLKIYQEHFESAYIKSTEDHYLLEAPAYLSENGVLQYMKYVSWNFLMHAIACSILGCFGAGCFVKCQKPMNKCLDVLDPIFEFMQLLCQVPNSNLPGLVKLEFPWNLGSISHKDMPRLSIFKYRTHFAVQ